MNAKAREATPQEPRGRHAEISGSIEAGGDYKIMLHVARGMELRPAETDRLLNLVCDYFQMIGFEAVSLGGLRRSRATNEREMFLYQIVKKGECWEDRFRKDDDGAEEDG